MQRKSLDVWVGLFIVVGVAALMFLALKAGNMSSLSFGKTYAVTAKFDNIGGLRPQAAVKPRRGGGPWERSSLMTRATRRW
jgi:phospholipid/cholesterol/gamma-HCH transport system substrate-binding protein